MKKYIFDQSNGLWYELQGDYYIPCLVLDETDRDISHLLLVCGAENTSNT